MQLFSRAAVTAAVMALLAAAAVPAAAAEAPFSFDATPGRLPKTVVPLDYTIAVTPNVERGTFAGRESVVLDVRKPATTIVFNTHDQTIAEARLDGARVTKVTTNNDTMLTTLTLAKPAPAGRHTLALVYTGKLETSPDGLFVQHYRNGTTSGTLLSTQFEATDARRMFPSWDEPAFRATYQLSVTLPAAWSAVSNTPVLARVPHGATTTTTFRRTPKMASYLVEFSGGDLARISARAPDGIEHGVWAVRGQEQNGAYALATSQQVLAFYQDYFGQKFPLPKLDHIAVPGGFSGAMENWGAITYNDQILLLPPSATTGQKQGIYSTEAHEMAHQWFGDLVTMAWWDDLWLNESFASWMSAKTTDRFNPTWDWWQAEDANKEGAMNADARASSHPIEQHVVNELQAEAAFDPEITYSKGQAVLRMTEAWLGDDTFRDGIRRYMAARRFSNATATDLWNALGGASGKDVATVAGAFVTQPGFPVMTVASSCDTAGNRTLSISQKRFLIDPSSAATNGHWSVPMRIASGTATPVSVLVTADGQRVAAGTCGEALRANAGDVGYYRVAYDDATLAANTKAFATLPDDDKINLLDDQYAQVRSGAAPLSSYLNLAAAMGNDYNARAWNQISASLGGIERFERGTPGHDHFVAYATSLVKPVAAALGWDAKPDETPARQELRRAAIEQLGAWGDAPTIAEARTRFAKIVANPNAYSPDDTAMIADVVGVNSDQTTFDQLHALAKGAKDPGQAQRFYAAMLATKNADLATQGIAIATSDEIPPQFAQAKLRFIAEASGYHPKLAWDYFTSHSETLLNAMSSFQRQIVVAQFVPQIFADAAPLDTIEAWVKAHTPPDAAPYVARGMERVRSADRFKQRIVPQADQFVAGGPFRATGTK